MSENILLSTPDPESLTQDKELRWNIMFRGSYKRGTDPIIDVHITDIHNQTNKVQLVEKVLRKHERRKKQLYLSKCLDQRRHFAPYMVTADGALRKEARAFHKALAHQLAKRWECFISLSNTVHHHEHERSHPTCVTQMLARVIGARSHHKQAHSPN